MHEVSCPACRHTFILPAPPASPIRLPDPSVVEWFRVDAGWTGAISTEEAYENYLRAIDTPPVSRARFVDDLSYLGVDQVLDDDTQMLERS